MATKKEIDELHAHVSALQNQLLETQSELKFVRDAILTDICRKMSDKDIEDILLVLSNRLETRDALMKIVRFVSGVA